MRRGTVFQIVGAGFLALAALIIYRGEFGVGRTGVVVNTRANDPELTGREFPLRSN